MSLFERIFNTKTEDKTLKILFGRYSDAYKIDAQYLEWDSAVHAFDDENYIESLEHFLVFLENENGTNLRKWMDVGILHFEMVQGSKQIVGTADSQRVEVEAKVAKTKGLDVGFMRQLMERNYELKYSRFALDKDNNISIRFDTDLIDASPYKMYNALKEVALNADKLDDLLVDEYDVLEAINVQHVEESTPVEKEVKYEFTVQWIDKTLQRTQQLNSRQLAAGEAYLLLDLTYKLDYLIKPEGFMMETLERIHRQYFARDNRTLLEKCAMLEQELERIRQRSKGELQKEFYHTIATFGITSPVNHDRVVSFIDGELPNMDWYMRNEYADIALAIPGYIAGYCMFEFAVPQPDKELFHLYFEIVESAYFKALGFNHKYYNPSNQRLDKSAIRTRIQQIAKDNRRTFPQFEPDTSLLNFKDLQQFSHSYMMMIRELDLSV